MEQGQGSRGAGQGAVVLEGLAGQASARGWLFREDTRRRS